MQDIFQSPPASASRLSYGDYSPGDDYDANLIRVKLFFYIKETSVKNRVFPEEWYTVLADEFGADQVTPEFQPWIEVSITVAEQIIKDLGMRI